MDLSMNCHQINWPRLTRRLAWVILACATVTPALRTRAEESPMAVEYRVKAGYLRNLVRFVEWPAPGFTASNAPVIVGVLDRGEVAAWLQEALKGKSVNGHPLEVKSLETPSPEAGCHILFVSRASGHTPASVRKALGVRPTLIVGETADFARQGGMIGFRYEAERVLLDLNPDAIQQTSLKMSARLASLATLVKGGPAQ